MNDITQIKNPLESDKQFSMVYTVAFSEPISKYRIQKYLTDSGRHTTITDDYKKYFNFSDRTDKRKGKLIQSKPEILIDLIKNKTDIDTITQGELLKLLTNKLLLKELKKTIENINKYKIEPINHNILLKQIALLFVGKFMLVEYRKFFKPSKKRPDFLIDYHKLDKAFLPELHNKNRQSKDDKDSIELRQITNAFKHDTIRKLIQLFPNHKLLLEITKAGILFSEAYKIGLGPNVKIQEQFKNIGQTKK